MDNERELPLPMQCNLILERDVKTNRYCLILKDFNNLKEGQTLTSAVCGDTIAECFIHLSEKCITQYKFVD